MRFGPLSVGALLSLPAHIGASVSRFYSCFCSSFCTDFSFNPIVVLCRLSGVNLSKLPY